MRRLLIALTVLAILWSGWWIAGAFAIERGITVWSQQQRSAGWQADIASLDILGFPFAWNADLEAVALTDPATGTRASTDSLRLRAAPYWPFAGRIDFAETPVTIETPSSKYFVKLNNGTLSGEVRPGMSADLKALSLSSGAWQLNSPQGNILSARSLEFNVDQNADTRDTYHLTLDADALTPGDVVRQALSVPPTWPRAFDRFDAQIFATVDPDSIGKSQTSPKAGLRQLDIQQINLVWGQLSLSALGLVTIDATGIPQGDLTLLFKNWRQAYGIAKEVGIVEAEIHFQTDLMLNALSNIGGDPETLELTLTFQNGAMFFGMIPLGPAPKILF